MQNEYLLSENHKQRCLYPDKYINSKPNIFKLNIQDIHAVCIFSKVKLNSLYITNHLIKQQLLYTYKPVQVADDIAFRKPNLYFRIVLRMIDDIKIIKDIVSRKSLFHDKHIVVVEINESLSKELATKFFAILKKCYNIFFIIYTDISIPLEIKQVCVNCTLPINSNTDPFNTYVDTIFPSSKSVNGDGNTDTTLVSKFITKHIEKLVKCQNNETYYSTLRKFTLNITASGIPIHSIVQHMLKTYPDIDIESLSLMESKTKQNVKSIFTIEHYINKIILKLKKID